MEIPFTPEGGFDLSFLKKPEITVKNMQFGEAVNFHEDNCKCSRCNRLREWRDTEAEVKA